MKRSTNFNGMRRYRNLGLEDFIETCKAVGMTDDEIIAAVKDMQNPPNKSLNADPKSQSDNSSASCVG